MIKRDYIAAHSIAKGLKCWFQAFTAQYLTDFSPYLVVLTLGKTILLMPLKFLILSLTQERSLMLDDLVRKWQWSEKKQTLLLFKNMSRHPYLVRKDILTDSLSTLIAIFGSGLQNFHSFAKSILQDIKNTIPLNSVWLPFWLSTICKIATYIVYH